MDENDLEVFANDKIPESIRIALAQALIEKAEKDRLAALENKRIDSDLLKFRWTTPLAIALTGLITLAGNYLVQRLSAKDSTRNTITLEQVKNELVATAEERKFQFEIVRSELENSSKSNSQRAAVLLFLARAGVLNTLKTDELIKMAEEQIKDPTQNIVPQLNAQDNSIFSRIWPNRTIPVCWEKADPAQLELRLLVQRAISSTWEAHSGVRFAGWEKCAESSEGVRIAVEDTLPDSKAVGARLNGMKGGIVLNFNSETWPGRCGPRVEQCIKATAVHLFGHVLGFFDENNRRDSPDDCSSYPFKNSDSLTPYDSLSVMNSCSPQFLNGGQLSESDIKEVQMLYGGPSG